MEAERQDEKDCTHTLDNEPRIDLRRPSCSLVVFSHLEHFPNGLRHLSPIARDVELLDGQARCQTGDQNVSRHRQGPDEKLAEVPPHGLPDDEVLRFPDKSHHATESRANGGVHHEVPEKTSKLIQVHGRLLRKAAIVLVVVVTGIVLQAVGDAVEDRVEARRDRDDDSSDSECIQERREHRPHDAEHERDSHLVLDPHHEFGEGEHEELTREVDPRNHKHEEHDHGEVVVHFFVHGFGAGQAQDDRFERQKATALERVALKRHGEAVDELHDQTPARDHGTGVDEEDRVEDQHRDDAHHEPVGRVAQKVREKGISRRLEDGRLASSRPLLEIRRNHRTRRFLASDDQSDSLPEGTIPLRRTSPCARLFRGQAPFLIVRHDTPPMYPKVQVEHSILTLSKSASPHGEGRRFRVE